MQKKIKTFLKVAIPVFLIVHFLGWWKFYYELRFYDKVIHFMAGISVFLVLFWWLSQKNISFLKKILICLLGLFLITFLWELSEYIIDNVFLLKPLQLGIRDTIGDIISNFLGATFAILFLFYSRVN